MDIKPYWSDREDTHIFQDLILCFRSEWGHWPSTRALTWGVTSLVVPPE